MVITRQQIIDNSYLWPERSVPYSMSSYDSPTGHRCDCSGYVSMCLGLAVSLSTVSLADVCSPIPEAALMPGDIIGNLGPGTEGANGHVQLFTGWDDWWIGLSEQAGGMYGPWRHSVEAMAWGYGAWRFNEVVDEIAENPTEEEEEIMQAWIAQDNTGIAVVWLAPLSGLVFQNIGASEAVAGWNAAGVPGPFVVPSIAALGKPAGVPLSTNQATDQHEPDADVFEVPTVESAG